MIIAEGAAGLVHLNVGYGSVYPVEFSNVKIVANHLAANAGWNQNGAPITITSRQTTTETLTMTDVEIVAANCPAVEFVITNAAVASQTKASFTNVKLSGSPVAVAVKSNNITGANHVFLTVDAASTFKGAADTYPIQETNGNFGLTPTYPEGYVLTAGEDGWYTFVPPHTCDYTVLKADEAGHWYECECGKKQSEEVTAHVNEAGNDHKCDTCEYVISQCNYVNGTCTICGGNDPNYVPTIGNGTSNGTVGEDGSTEVSIGNVTVVVSKPESGWKIGENTFTVSSTNDVACVVLVKKANGSYERVDVAGDAAAQTTNPAHTFTTVLEKGDEIVVMVRGDVNADGTVDIFDVTGMRRVAAGTKTLNDDVAIAADTNKDGCTDIFDVTGLRRVAAGTKILPW